jgi:hypothetical protein
MNTTTNKPYDWVEAVRKERDQIAADTEGKTPKEILEYFRQRRDQISVQKEPK